MNSNSRVKNLFNTMVDYTIVACDLGGCLILSKTGYYIFKNILHIKLEKFRPICLNYIRGVEINKSPKPGEKVGSLVGCLIGMLFNLFSYGIIPAIFLIFDIIRSFYLNKKISKH